MSKATVSAKQNEDNKRILNELLKLPCNRICSECGAKGPRWASANLGVFFCIRCSGIHRNLGVHISQVRSTTLDTWLPEQVEIMRMVGNENARAYYEHRLPRGFVRPTEASDNYSVEQFIRAKYERKEWVNTAVDPPQKVGGKKKHHKKHHHHHHKDHQAHHHTHHVQQQPQQQNNPAPQQTQPPAQNVQIIDFFDAAASNHEAATAAAAKSSADPFSDFGEFSSTPVAGTHVPSYLEHFDAAPAAAGNSPSKPVDLFAGMHQHAMPANPHNPPVAAAAAPPSSTLSFFESASAPIAAANNPPMTAAPQPQQASSSQLLDLFGAPTGGAENRKKKNEEILALFGTSAQPQPQMQPYPQPMMYPPQQQPMMLNMGIGNQAPTPNGSGMGMSQMRMGMGMQGYQQNYQAQGQYGYQAGGNQMMWGR